MVALHIWVSKAVEAEQGSVTGCKVVLADGDGVTAVTNPVVGDVLNANVNTLTAGFTPIPWTVM